MTALELAVFAPDETRTWELPARGEVKLGRGEDNDVRLEHFSVSRAHAILRVGDSLQIEDLGGANGTYVAERSDIPGALETVQLRRLLRQTAEVRLGESVMLGQVAIVVRPRQVVSEFGDLGAAEPEGGMVLKNPAMRTLYAQAERVAKAPITLLILGETGVGKELLAHAVHARSSRAKKPFLGVNCAAFSEALLEGELFGYEKGAFTGALQARPGLFEATQGGTVFLDEIGEISLSTQAKLLRVLEERSVLRLGARTPTSIDVRFVAATNRDLEAEAASGRFRQDLYFRLNGISLTIPPLRERRDEILPLAQRFLESASGALPGPWPKLSQAAVAALEAYDWPGNVRELRNAVERALVVCTGSSIEAKHLPPALTRSKASTPAAAPAPSAPATERPSDPAAAQGLHAERRALERQRVLDALERSGGNQTRAAELLGISRRTLVSWLDEFGVPRPRKP
jgi:two-component system response regulator AtoC